MVYQKRNDITLLKAFVYAMGIVMMLGTVILTYIIYKRNFNNLQEHTVEYNIKNCDNSNLILNSSGKIIKMIVQDNKIFALTESDEIKQQLFIIDYCSGQIISKITINDNDKGRVNLITSNSSTG